MATGAPNGGGSERRDEAERFLAEHPDPAERRRFVLVKLKRGEPVSDVEAWMADDQPTGTVEHVGTDYGDGGPGFPRATFRSEVDGVPVFVVVCTDDDGAPKVERVTFEVGQLPAGFTSRFLRRVGAPELIDDVGREMDRPSVLWTLPRSWGLGHLRAKRTRSTDDSVYAIWTARYERALDVDPKRPTKVLVGWFGHLGYTESAIRNYLHEAGRRGLKEKAPPGRPGGGLTAKGRRALLGVPPQEYDVPTGED